MFLLLIQFKYELTNFYFSSFCRFGKANVLSHPVSMFFVCSMKPIKSKNTGLKTALLDFGVLSVMSSEI